MTSAMPRLSIIGAGILVFGAASFAFAQPLRAGRQGSPMYDTKTEVTVSGTVESVETIAGPAARGRQGLGGTHLVLRIETETETETFEVHLGPSAFLNEKNINIVKGEAVEILGSRITIDNKPVLLARQMKKGDKTWALRDASGRPMWSRPRR
jgi:DNA/RNA endonuclease YhcR with UshA esterase domain